MIVLIDNYDSFTHNLYQSLAQHHPDIKVVRNDKISIAEVKQLNPKGIVLSPGPGRPENAGICMELIQQCDPETPLLGVCLGHQAIAIAFGGKVISAPEIVHGKDDLIFHCRKNLYEQMPLPFSAGRYHSLIVDKQHLPPVLVVEAQTKMGEIMGMRHISLPIFGVQFHPESILTPEGNQLLKNFVQLCLKRDIV